MGLSCSCLDEDTLETTKQNTVRRPFRDTSSVSVEDSEDCIDTDTESVSEGSLPLSIPLKVDDELYEGLYDDEKDEEVSDYGEDVSDNEVWGIGTPLFESRELSFDIVDSERFQQLALFSESVESLSKLLQGKEELALYPPLAKATLRLKLGAFRLSDDASDEYSSESRSSTVRSSALKRKSSSRRRSLSLRRTSITRRLSLSSERPGSARKKKKRTVQIKARYLYGGNCDKRKSAKMRSREYDSGIVDIRETLEFALQTRADGVAVGHLELLVKQMGARFAKDKVLGYTSFSLRECLLNGVIDRSGDGTEATLEFFAKKRMEHILPCLRIDGEDCDGAFDEEQRELRGRIDVKLQLSWDLKTWNEFKCGVAKPCDDGAVIANPMRLMQTHTAKLKLTIVGALLSQGSVHEWMQLEEAELCPTLRQMGSCHGDYGDTAVVSRVSVSVRRRFNGEDDVRRGEEHASKVDEAIFIGEEHHFDVAPYFRHRPKLVGRSSLECESGVRIHPQLEFRDFEDGEENPGYLLLSVQKTERVKGEDVSETLGCTLLKITELLDAATVAPGSMRSAENLFMEAMFKPLTSTSSVHDRKHLKLPLFKRGSVFYKCHFEWQ